MAKLHKYVYRDRTYFLLNAVHVYTGWICNNIILRYEWLLKTLPKAEYVEITHWIDHEIGYTHHWVTLCLLWNIHGELQAVTKVGWESILSNEINKLLMTIEKIIFVFSTIDLDNKSLPNRFIKYFLYLIYVRKPVM